MTTQTTVVVIGAGPDGLVASSRLGIAGVGSTVSERAGGVAPLFEMRERAAAVAIDRADTEVRTQ